MMFVIVNRITGRQALSPCNGINSIPGDLFEGMFCTIRLTSAVERYLK